MLDKAIIRQVMQRMKGTDLEDRSDEISEILSGVRTAKVGMPVTVERANGKTAPNGEAYHIRIVASSTGVARDGGIVPLKAWGRGGLKNFQANPVIQPFHDYTQLPVAKSVYTELDKERDAMVQYWNFHGETELSRQMQRLYESGYMRAASVGFIIHEAEYIDLEEEARLQEEMGTRDPIYWRALRAELLETSAVPVPADAKALTIEHALRNADAAGLDTAAIVGVLEGFTSGRTILKNAMQRGAPAEQTAAETETVEGEGQRSEESTDNGAGTSDAGVSQITEAIDRAVARITESVNERFTTLEQRLAALEGTSEEGSAEGEGAADNAAQDGEGERNADEATVSIEIEKREGESDEDAVARYVDEIIARQGQ